MTSRVTYASKSMMWRARRVDEEEKEGQHNDGTQQQRVEPGGESMGRRGEESMRSQRR